MLFVENIEFPTPAAPPQENKAYRNAVKTENKFLTN